MYYNAPLLTHSVRDAGYNACIGTTEKHLFKDGKFKLVLQIDTTEDSERVDREGRTNDDSIDKFLIETIEFVDEDLKSLYKRMGLKEGKDALRKNIAKTAFIREAKSYLHQEAHVQTKQTSYLIKGDAVYISKCQGEWVFVNYHNKNKDTIVSGWIEKKGCENLN